MKSNKDGVLHAVLFKFRGTNPKRAALTKRVKKPGRNVIYYYLQSPMYYKWEGENWVHYSVKDGRPKYKKGDSVIFVFDDRSKRQVKRNSIGVSIDFQQAIGPFDDEVAAEVKMAAATPYDFTDRNGTRPTFALGWKVQSPGRQPRKPPVGFPFESNGIYEYTVSVLTFNPELGKGKGKGKGMSAGRSLRYWIDPTMCVGGACSG